MSKEEIIFSFVEALHNSQKINDATYNEIKRKMGMEDWDEQ